MEDQKEEYERRKTAPRGMHQEGKNDPSPHLRGAGIARFKRGRHQRSASAEQKPVKNYDGLEASGKKNTSRARSDTKRGENADENTGGRTRLARKIVKSKWG